MIYHKTLSENSFARSKVLYLLIKNGKITLAGNFKDKIYGTLYCRFGKRMKAKNRVFFVNKPEAVKAGYRPCAQCLPVEYKIWKTKRSINKPEPKCSK